MIVEIDLTSAMPAGLAAYPAVIRGIIPDIAEAVRTEIVRRAGQELGTTANDYIQGLLPVQYHFPSGKVPDGEHTVATIALAGWLPNALEQGWSGGDLKVFLLSGRNSKTAKGGGRYNVVPFRHGAPGGSRRNIQKMGDAHEKAGRMTHKQAQKMARSVHKAAKNLKPGERLGAGHSPKLRPHHSTSIHTGMQRQRKKYKSATQSKYMTFRTVSSKSSGWVHPGIEPHEFFDEAADYADKVAGKLFQKALSGAAKGAP